MEIDMGKGRGLELGGEDKTLEPIFLATGLGCYKVLSIANLYRILGLILVLSVLLLCDL